MRRRAAAVVAAAVACALAAGAVELGYLWLKGSSVFKLRSVAVRGGTESDRVAVRDAVARAAAGRSLLAISPASVAGDIEQVPTIRLASVDRDFPHTLRIHIVPERAVALAVGRGPLPQPRRREWPRAARLRARTTSCRRCRASGRPRAPDRRAARSTPPRRWPRSMRWRRARPISAPSRQREGGARARNRDAPERRSRHRARPAAGSCTQIRWPPPGFCVTIRRAPTAHSSCTPTSRRPTGPQSCRAAATRRPRGSASSQDEDKALPNRSEWRLMRAIRSCIVRQRTRRPRRGVAV